MFSKSNFSRPIEHDIVFCAVRARPKQPDTHEPEPADSLFSRKLAALPARSQPCLNPQLALAARQGQHTERQQCRRRRESATHKNTPTAEIQSNSRARKDYKNSKSPVHPGTRGGAIKASDCARAVRQSIRPPLNIAPRQDLLKLHHMIPFTTFTRPCPASAKAVMSLSRLGQDSYVPVPTRPRQLCPCPVSAAGRGVTHRG